MTQKTASRPSETAPSQPGAPWRRLRRTALNLGITLASGLVVAGIAYGIMRGTGGSGAVAIQVASLGPPPTVGKPAPDFRLPILDDGAFQLAEARGSVVWLNFWATWCPPCRAEMPDIQSVWDQVKDTGVVLVAVDLAESPQTVREFVQRTGLTFPIGMDTNGGVFGLYNINGLPTHYFIGADGTVRGIRVGPMKPPEMLRRLDEARRGK